MNTPDLRFDDAGPSGRFEDRLLTALRPLAAEHREGLAALTGSGSSSTDDHRRTRERRVGKPALAAATIVAAVAALVPLLHTAPAYAVERDPDGSIRVTIRQYTDAAGLQKRIESFGVKAAVDFLPARMVCQGPRADFVAPEKMPLGMVDWSTLSEPDHYFKVHPEYIGPGQTFVYAAQVNKGSTKAAIRLADGPVGPCLPIPGDTLIAGG
ncbi:hypothetical protein [Actinoplanes sp. HUAS TT8]|uniref:hypothetical protein n=1 Tax=Actinoplanes sp. HUAS TT8 TaxID=3447453 RepID=UPI003F51CC89